MKKVYFLLLITSPLLGQSLQELTVSKIMRDPKWIGTPPTNISWSEDSKQIYFNWNPDAAPGDSLYTANITTRTPAKVSPAVRRSLPMPGVYNRARTKKVYEKSGDLYFLDIPTGKVLQITNTVEGEFNPQFSLDEKKIFFTAGMNLFSWEMAGGTFSQVTNFKRGSKKMKTPGVDQEDWLKDDQLRYFQVLKQRHDNKLATAKSHKQDYPNRPKSIHIEDKNVDNIMISPDQNFITFRLTKVATSIKNTVVPNYVTESGFTEDIPARSKVGVGQNTYEFLVYDIKKDTVLAVSTSDIPGIFDPTDFAKDYPPKKKENDAKDKKPEPRPVIVHGPFWSADGKNNYVVVKSEDNKDRWIMSLDLSTQKLKLLDRMRDEAWIGGPGIGNFFGQGDGGWLSDNKSIWFSSEDTGYSHIYVVDITTGKRQAITSGKYEVQDAELSRDKKYFYITTNEVHPGEKQFYRLPVTGGKAERLTTLTGANEVFVSPDEKWLAIRYSYTNKPWELYISENKVNAKPQAITNSLTKEFQSYPWRDPEIITFKARDGVDIYARLYRPKSPEAKGPAVVFVHGAGYLQNAHKWWSLYFHEYLFHNLLADKGYTVIDIDYRGSAGYGRDLRTGIYRYMGGKDLTDHLDAAKLLVDKYDVDPKRMGIYGGSYGGFIALMAMFTMPDVFAAGAALRPVTDWAHYNHPYTANILNTPVLDSMAYIKSSPIYYAEGLKGALLICHGMVDVNVHYQDAVLLSQRLIELGKDNWEMAGYPMEDHGFVEASSWTDEYKRILKLFETNLRK